ncbi:EboA domain-containing protein [Blastococcus capsensis]|uniref:EboA domain-containing protein n=1 Tax=Blastococcus capsensis TaxID=1564163 RepID=UPI0025409BFB|nr:EboA domain-containing protein [Blastococcus capsensis]MDK3256796.1 EboA domain-containing protein [Blastococcus capsensis]
MTGDELRQLLDRELEPAGRAWLAGAEAAVRKDPRVVQTAFPAAGRSVGRRLLAGDPPTGWTADDAARALLLITLGDAAGEQVPDLFGYGDADEQRAVVRSLHLLPPVPGAAELVAAASRSNDRRLVAASLGPWALAHLDDEAVAQSVLKCVFQEVPLTGLPGLAERATPRLSRMLAELAHERIAAGRPVPEDVWPLIERFPPEDTLARIEAEQEHPVPERRAAARAALASRRGQET